MTADAGSLVNSSVTLRSIHAGCLLPRDTWRRLPLPLPEEQVLSFDPFADLFMSFPTVSAASLLLFFFCAGDSSEHPLFCVEYSPYCSVFAFSPVLQPNTSYCCLVLPLVPPASAVAQDRPTQLPPVHFPSFVSPAASPPGPAPQSPAALCYFPVSPPTPAETPVLCLPGPRRPSKIYLMW